MKEHNHNDDCNCGCNQEHSEEMRTMKVQLEDGTETEFGVVDIFEAEGYDKKYIALVTLDGEQVYLYEYLELEDGGVSLENIEDDQEFDAVAEIFESNISEE